MRPAPARSTTHCSLRYRIPSLSSGSTTAPSLSSGSTSAPALSSTSSTILATSTSSIIAATDPPKVAGSGPVPPKFDRSDFTIRELLAEASDCACLAYFLAAALVCQPHEHGLFSTGLNKDPCLHFLIEDCFVRRFLALPANAGRPSAKSINCSAYCPMPWKR